MSLPECVFHVMGTVKIEEIQFLWAGRFPLHYLTHQGICGPSAGHFVNVRGLNAGMKGQIYTGGAGRSALRQTTFPRAVTLTGLLHTLHNLIVLPVGQTRLQIQPTIVQKHIYEAP
jgi:hypothetical protein